MLMVGNGLVMVDTIPHVTEGLGQHIIVSVPLASPIQLTHIAYLLRYGHTARALALKISIFAWGTIGAGA